MPAQSSRSSSFTPRQLEILEHALNLVREGGLPNLTTRRLAERVGFSEAALYRHFAGKSAVVLGLTYLLEEMLLGTVEEITTDKESPVADRLDRVLRFHIRLNQENNSLPILLLAQASTSGDAELSARMRKILGRYLGYLEDLAEEARAEGSLRLPPHSDCMALLILGLPAAFAIRHRLLPDPEFEERVLDNLVPYLVSSILPSEGGEQ